MRIFTGRNAVRRAPIRVVATVGMFDGVHRAHQQLIRETVRRARRVRGTSVIVTFEPDPYVVLYPRRAKRAQPILMPLAARLACFAELGVDRAWVISFTKAFSRTSAEEFVRRYLVERLRARTLVIGAAFMFGRGRQGNLALLRRLGSPCGMRVVSVRPVRLGGRLVSSSRVRRLVAAGHLGQAARLLGRPPTIYGTVVRGAGRGRPLGFPTANIRLASQVLPPRGVYAVIARGGHGRLRGRRWRGVMNLGVRPTFGAGPMTCEVHVLQFPAGGSLLARPISLELIARIRAERRFPHPQALARQIRRDVVRALQLLS